MVLHGYPSYPCRGKPPHNLQTNYPRSTGAEPKNDTVVGGLIGALVGIVGGPVGMLLCGSYVYLEDDDPYFFREYGKVTPLEDRATLIEALFDNTESETYIKDIKGSPEGEAVFHGKPGGGRDQGRGQVFRRAPVLAGKGKAPGLFHAGVRDAEDERLTL